MFYLSECPDTGRVFLCETGKDDNIAEVFDYERWIDFMAWAERGHGQDVKLEGDDDEKTLPNDGV